MQQDTVHHPDFRAVRDDSIPDDRLSRLDTSRRRTAEGPQSSRISHLEHNAQSSLTDRTDLLEAALQRRSKSDRCLFVTYRNSISPAVHKLTPPDGGASNPAAGGTYSTVAPSVSPDPLSDSHTKMTQGPRPVRRVRQ